MEVREGEWTEARGERPKERARGEMRREERERVTQTPKGSALSIQASRRGVAWPTRSIHPSPHLDQVQQQLVLLRGPPPHILMRPARHQSPARRYGKVARRMRPPASESDPYTSVSLSHSPTTSPPALDRPQQGCRAGRLTGSRGATCSSSRKGGCPFFGRRGTRGRGETAGRDETVRGGRERGALSEPQPD